MNITHAKLVTLPVTDQERAKDFYVGTLGFGALANVRRAPCAGSRWDRPVRRPASCRPPPSRASPRGACAG
ncbi:VOC family protein [Streptomyces sp. NPDC021100]|uniref:VOC family protein n=1 Tax=Streptomyces sp. NPDC021100 TaxID=3365114 RepID=UPI00379A32B7